MTSLTVRPAVVGRALAASALASGVATAVGYHVFASERSQALGPFPFAVDTDERVVALTFDDGPNPPWTLELLDVLRRHGARATFFQPGACASRFPDVTRRVVAEGHVVGNHSFGHQFARLWRPADIRAEVERAQDVLEPLVGGRPSLYRPPWLWRTPALFEELQRQGMQAVGGIFGHPAEVRQPSPGALARSARTRVRPGRILILHDGYNAIGAPRHHTVAAVDRLLPRLADDGYRFVTVDELLGVRALL